MRILIAVLLITFFPFEASAEVVQPEDSPRTFQVFDLGTLSIPEPTLAEVTYGISRAADRENRASAEQEARLSRQADAPISVRTPAVPGKTNRGNGGGDVGGGIRDRAYTKVTFTWDASQWPYFDQIIESESGWNPSAVNPSSFACGLPQALPCSKLGSMEVDHQIDWTINYVKERYGTPQAAWSFHLKNGYY